MGHLGTSAIQALELNGPHNPQVKTEAGLSQVYPPVSAQLKLSFVGVHNLVPPSSFGPSVLESKLEHSEGKALASGDIEKQWAQILLRSKKSVRRWSGQDRTVFTSSLPQSQRIQRLVDACSDSFRQGAHLCRERAQGW